METKTSGPQSILSKIGATISSSVKASDQNSKQVFIRNPGERLLSGPFEASPYAKEHWQFAHLANAAYQDTPAANIQKTNGLTAAAVDSEAILRSNGWAPWKGKFTPAEVAAFANFHLRVEVWEHESTRRVAVCFGGTVINNENDWKSNLRWFIPDHKDEYSEIVQNFVPAFVREFRKLYARPDGAIDSDIAVFATGHSLGGGLAQQFAYCLPLVPDSKTTGQKSGPSINAVYAFDPSPVTGFYSVVAADRDKNVIELFIDRVYERGEILSTLRLITSLFVPPSAVDPKIRSVRYSLFFPKSINLSAPLTGHSIVDLATSLQAAAGY